jgi:hypothetical protein
VEFTWGGAPQTNYTSIPQWVPGKPEKHLAVTTRLSLPMTVSSGRWFSTLTPSAEYNYNNGLIYIPVNDYSGNLTHGVERLTMALRYTGQTRMALSELQPRWGLTARMAHVSNPTNERFKSLWSASMSAYLPGLVRPHGVRVRAAWQKSTGPQSTIFSFQLKEVFPTGANYNFSAKQWFSTSADYSLPVLYPEAGLPGILYFKRVRLNLFVDYANWWNFPSKDNPTIRNRLYSYGANLTLDMNPLRLPATNHFSTTFTIAKPGDRAGIFFNVSLEMPL